MKRTDKFLLSTFMLAAIITLYSQSNVEELTKIEILSESSKETDSLFVEQDNTLNGYVEISYLKIIEKGYMISVFKGDQDSIRRRNWFIPANKKYTHAFYCWKNDSTVNVEFDDLESGKTDIIYQIIDLPQYGSIKQIKKG